MIAFNLKGHTILVDDEDAEILERHSWTVKPARSRFENYYVFRRNRSSQAGAPQTIYLHRQILRAPAGLVVDHINGNGLDNRRGNLRLATNSLNSANKPRGYTPRSGFRGVYQKDNRWQARISVNGRMHSHGSFIDRVEAAKAYDRAALAAFGEFATLNFPVSA